MNTPYLKFIMSVPAQTMRILDPVEQRLIESLCEQWAVGKRPAVKEAMLMTIDSISPSTVHRRLKSLRAKGFLELITDERDSRMKYVMPTAMLIQTFELMGEAMRQAVQPQPGE